MHVILPLCYIFAGPNQVDEFLHHHGGAGIQHIGLHTDNIINAVSHLKQSGVDFAEPPYTYYTKVFLWTVYIIALDKKGIQINAL